ncbi:MAG TPA: signal peptidase I [Candidatus Limivivens intestinipullorum]|uniref:Signal peptidase I n=1 Tax=Candidatus Limivivens intestinipullorum TaxID=2840858 RepID=A0A9D1JJ19_9FIRM|nr:signal peptidase I [Candidatus Limivivens intestinipullorum]
MSKENNETKEEEKKSVGREIAETAVYILIVLVLTYLVITYVGQRTTVSGMSMYPTLEDGDNLITDKISYRFTDPKRYDIVVFPFTESDGSTRNFIKRIIGLPGETVQIIDGEVYINGELLGENYGAEIIENPGVAAEPITLGDDEYFVMGDNRNNSKDSRYAEVGNIKREDLIGRAFIRIWPLNKFGLLKHQ